MELYDFRDDYQSPSRQPGWFARRFPGVHFYGRATYQVFRAAWLARGGRYTSDEWIHDSHHIMRGLERVGVRITVCNPGVFQRIDGPCVVVGNHMSTLETFLLPGIIQPRNAFTFVVKQALVQMPVFRHVMRSRDPIVVGRSNPRDDFRIMLEEGSARLQQGISIVVFPQTTRTTTFNPAQFNSIGVKLARKAKVPVIPLALRSDAWGQGKWIKDAGRIDPERPVHMVFGEPIHVTGQGREAHEQVVAFIRQHFQEWGLPVAE